MKYMNSHFFLIYTLLYLFVGNAPSKAQSPFVEKYNVIWTSPSENSLGSMPLGNGDIGLNAWIDNNGDLLFYISKTDSWNETNRLCKLGLVRINFRPNFLKKDLPFRQVLNIKKGVMEAYIGKPEEQLNLRLWVDANNPVIRIEAEGKKDFEMQVSLELVRKKERTINKTTSSEAYNNYDGKNLYETVVYPDAFVRNLTNKVAWYHHNTSSTFDVTMDLQGLQGYKSQMTDPLLNRVFGGMIIGEGFSGSSAIVNTLVSSKVRKKHSLAIVALTQHPSSPEQWLNSINQLAEKAANTNIEQAFNTHSQWWENFWSRSWLMASGNVEAENISRAYTLQRFINACGGRGEHPIKFNGTIFTIPDYVLSKDDLKTGLERGDPDFRRWGPGFWLQNTRLMYWSMLSAGDYDLMKSFFEMYMNVLDLTKHRTQTYFGHGGAHFPESIYFWGADVNDHYGWIPFAERTDKTGMNKYTKYEWQGGLEVTAIMLDYFAHTQNRDFLEQKLLPFAKEVLEFYESHYKKNEQGKLQIEPAQALETWWDCTNPMPEVAGLHFVLDNLLALPESTNGSERSKWQALKQSLPEIPTTENRGQRMLAPAQRFANKQNRELPELYAVFPYRLFGIGKNTNIDIAKNALKNRDPKSNAGWPQDEIFMAFLGETEQLQTLLNNRALAKDASLRFPAFWGPNFDWTPDQCHGSVINIAFQSMLMQCEGKKIMLFPAWLQAWDADFKLKAPYNTTVEGQFKGGRLVNLKVSPKEREIDVQVMQAR